ncbi:hypothetical protein [Demequina globuliformis]|uniref:hypothetical protein n=1 Tax=Demequina globuliformis TaxID=676202 RepID=UPI0007844367|nr:hypothetical protein [Demequina globuliformis]
MSLAFAGGTVGIAMVFWGLERAALVRMAQVRGESNGNLPFSVYLTLFVGLCVTFFLVAHALRVWGAHLQEHPQTKQMRVWVAILIMVIAGAVLITALAIHAAWMREQVPVPTEPDLGFVLFETLCVTIVLIPLVLIGVRWAPGYKAVRRA